jgi:DNA-binding winged helix-turn-helix (wHTH) protein
MWKGRIVSNSTVASRINAAHKALGDSQETQRLIRTNARKGVRFVGDAPRRPHSRRVPSARADRTALQGLTTNESPLVEMRAVTWREAQAAGQLELAAVAGLLEKLRIRPQADR